MPKQNEMMYLWNEIAKNKNHTELKSLNNPKATPSKISCKLRAKTTRNPRNEAFKFLKLIIKTFFR